MQVKIGITFHRAEITYFEINRCLRQADSAADHMRRNLLLKKVQVQIRLFTKNCVTQTEILLASFLIYFIFRITPVLLLPKLGVSTLFSTKMRWEETQSQEHQHPCLSNLLQKQDIIIIVCL